MKKNLQVVGIMSGTSLDGVDFALCQIHFAKKNLPQMKLIDRAYSRFPRLLRQRLLKAVDHNICVDQLAELDFNLGRFYAQKLSQHQRQKGWKINLIGLHGQTVYHRGGHASLQIGQPTFLAKALTCPVISNLRSIDIAKGGQGAPLATYFHHKILAPNAQKWLASLKLSLKNKSSATSSLAKGIAIQNIGGIANVTFVVGQKCLASYDIGPGNILMDNLMRQITHGKSHYDRNGHLAFKGIPDIGLVKKWMKNPLFVSKPPKSFDRKVFAGDFFQKCLKDLKGLPDCDKMATFADLTARLIVQSYQTHLPFKPKMIVLCGGGALNRYLVHRIKYHASAFHPHLITSGDLGWPINAVEAGAFALLAAHHYLDLP